MNEQPQDSFLRRCIGETPRDWRNMKRTLGALVIWAITFTGGSQLIKRDLLPPGPIPWIIAIAATLAWILVMLAFGRYLKEADEMQRKIQLNGLALGFGGGWLAIFGYEMFARLGVPTTDVGDITLFMAAFYVIGLLFGAWRYR